METGRAETGLEPLQLAAGSLLQCEYHLLDFDCFQRSGVRGSSVNRVGSGTLRRRRRGAVVGRGKDRGLVRSRENDSLARSQPPQIAAIENSVLWETSGKGDTDFGVHFFERREARKHQAMQLHRPYMFRTVCPNSPLTYQGTLLSISWLVRVRVFMNSGDAMTFERRFQLVAPQ